MNQNQLTIIRGDTRAFEVTLNTIEGGPLDLTGVGLSFSVEGLFTKTDGDGIEVETPASGVATITVDPDDTANCPDTRMAYRYDVQVTFPDGRIRTPMFGLFVVRPDVTSP